MIGCAVAFELSRRGAAVRIVDQRAPGMGATQASAGVLAPFIEAREDGPLLELTVRSLELYDGFVAQVASVSGATLGYDRNGTLDVALREETVGHFRKTLGVLARYDVSGELLGPDELNSIEPSLSRSARAGLLIASHGFVNALDLTRATAEAAVRQGATMVEARVSRIETSGSGLIVETDRQSLTCGNVVLATGSWAGDVPIAGVSVRLPVRPVRGQLLRLGWPQPRLRRVTWGERCYLVPWNDGTVLVGATVEEAGFDERATAGGVHLLLAAAIELVPQARAAEFVGTKVGLRPGTPDDLPVIGPSQIVPNLIYATGHYRNGILLAPLTANLVAGALVDHQRDRLLEMTSPGRFGSL